MNNMEAIKTNLKVWCRRFGVDEQSGDDERAYKAAPTSVRRGPICMATIRHIQATQPSVDKDDLLQFGWLVAHGVIGIMDGHFTHPTLKEGLLKWATSARIGHTATVAAKHGDLICSTVALALARRDAEKTANSRTVTGAILNKLHKR